MDGRSAPMKLPPDAIHACPHCDQPIRVAVPERQGDRGAIHWTDGYVLLRTYGQPAAISRCGTCRRVYWLEDAPRLGTLPASEGLEPQEWALIGVNEPAATLAEPSSGPRPWSEAPRQLGLSLAEWLEAITAGVGVTPARQHQLRLEALWQSNHRARFRVRRPPRRSPTDLENLRVLMTSAARSHEASGAASDALFCAELLRLIGEFEPALAWLDKVTTDPVHAEHLGLLRRLVEAKDQTVERLDADRRRARAKPAPRRSRPPPPLRLVERTREDFEDMGDYFASFAEPLQPGTPRLEAMAAFARRLGAELLLTNSGAPFGDAACCISICPLTQSEADQFRLEFAPLRDGRIEIL